ncbi:MAG: GlxA family transcriptional regulator [Ruegeria sp.]|uniref:GlxA family transcriptional regulator n=1 Tax=Ruegeria sp. TaxID=1879320 RepID=UPI00349E7CA4
MNKINSSIARDFPVGKATRPISCAFILIPGFSSLDLAAAVAPLAATNRICGRTVYDYNVYSVHGGPVESANGSLNSVDGALADIRSDARCFILSFDDPWAHIDMALSNWLRHRERHENALLGCIGTSTVAVIEAGVLRRRPFTVHWSIQAAFEERYPDLVPASSIFTEASGLVTCAGGQSTSDMMMSLVARDTHDRVSLKVADFLLGQAPRPSDTPQRLSASVRYNTRNPMFLSVVQAIDENRIEGLTVDELVERFGISRRQIERTFNSITGMPPTQFIKRKRLEKARDLLNQTNMSVMDVAIATGFGSVANFSKSFTRQYGVRPSQCIKSQFSADAVTNRTQ